MPYNSAELESKKITRILQSNFRNSRAITGLANRLIIIKQKRFGSIDKESTYLMNSLSEEQYSPDSRIAGCRHLFCAIACLRSIVRLKRMLRLQPFILLK